MNRLAPAAIVLVLLAICLRLWAEGSAQVSQSQIADAHRHASIRGSGPAGKTETEQSEGYGPVSTNAPGEILGELRRFVSSNGLVFLASGRNQTQTRAGSQSEEMQITLLGSYASVKALVQHLKIRHPTSHLHRLTLRRLPGPNELEAQLVFHWLVPLQEATRLKSAGPAVGTSS